MPRNIYIYIYEHIYIYKHITILCKYRSNIWHAFADQATARKAAKFPHSILCIQMKFDFPRPELPFRTFSKVIPYPAAFSRKELAVAIKNDAIATWMDPVASGLGGPIPRKSCD